MIGLFIDAAFSLIWQHFENQTTIIILAGGTTLDLFENLFSMCDEIYTNDRSLFTCQEK